MKDLLMKGCCGQAEPLSEILLPSTSQERAAIHRRPYSAHLTRDIHPKSQSYSMSDRPTASRTTSHQSHQSSTPHSEQNQPQRQDKGKGKERDEAQSNSNRDGQSQSQSQKSGSEKQEMREIRRAQPLPAVKGTIGGIGESNLLAA